MDDHQETVARLQDKGGPADGRFLPWYEREFNIGARASAAIFIPLGLLGMWWNWNLVHTQGHYYPTIACLSPFMIVLGAFYLLFPDEDPHSLPSLFKLRHWILFLIALPVGLANWYALANGLY